MVIFCMQKVLNQVLLNFKRVKNSRIKKKILFKPVEEIESNEVLVFVEVIISHGYFARDET